MGPPLEIVASGRRVDFHPHNLRGEMLSPRCLVPILIGRSPGQRRGGGFPGRLKPLPRSESDAELEMLEQALLAAVRQGVAEENKLRAASGMRVEAENKLLATRYGGFTPPASPLVKAAEWATRAIGRETRLVIGSTYSNVPINMGIPALTLGGGGRSGSAHSVNEWFEPEGAWRGIEKVLLTVLAYDAGVKEYGWARPT